MMNDEKETKTIWEGLGIEVTRDMTVIKSAFLTCAKKVDPEEQPNEFIELKELYRWACAYAVDDELFSHLDPSEGVEIELERAEQKPITIESWLTQTLKESEPLLVKFSKALRKWTRRNSRMKKFFKSKEYLAYRENREFIEILTDYLCYGAEGKEYCQRLMAELNRLQDQLSDNLYIYGNIKYIKKKQLKFNKPFWSPDLIFYVVIPVLMFLIMSLFMGTQILTIMVVVYAPASLVVLIYKIIFKYS